MKDYGKVFLEAETKLRRNSVLVDEAMVRAQAMPFPSSIYFRGALCKLFPPLAELDREITPEDYNTLPREAAKED